MIEPPGAVLISARTGEGLETLLSEIARRVAALRHPVELLVPYEKGAALSLIHEKGQVLSEEYGRRAQRSTACSTPRCTGACSSCWRGEGRKMSPAWTRRHFGFCGAMRVFSGFPSSSCRESGADNPFIRLSRC